MTSGKPLRTLLGTIVVTVDIVVPIASEGDRAVYEISDSNLGPCIFAFMFCCMLPRDLLPMLWATC
jgi:hypothetical protein